jgi:hypothetical protein
MAAFHQVLAAGVDMEKPTTQLSAQDRVILFCVAAVFSRASDRMLRAIALYTRYALC